MKIWMRNNEIAQVIANIFQAKTVRLTVTGSVALGSAIRAANVILGLPQAELELKFCQIDRSSLVEPQESTKEIYEVMLKQYAEKLSALMK